MLYSHIASQCRVVAHASQQPTRVLGVSLCPKDQSSDDWIRLTRSNCELLRNWTWLTRSSRQGSELSDRDHTKHGILSHFMTLD